MTDVAVKSHTRRKPSRSKVYIDKHAQLRSEIEEARKPKTPGQWVLFYAGKLAELAGGK